jgi:hypothetical protein
MNTAKLEYILEQIRQPTIRQFTRTCLEDSDPTLEIIPASVSGKYHPKECCEEGGLIVHIQRACYFGYMFIKSHQWEENIKGDILLSSLLLHDIAKKQHYKFNEYNMHPVTASIVIAKHKDIIAEKVFNIIANCVKYHMGPWTPKSHQKTMESYTQLEMMTYLADYLSSQKTVVIDQSLQ